MAARGPHVVLEDLVPRLKKAAAAAADARESYELKLQHRNQLVVKAVDEGTSWAAIAEAIGVKRPRIAAILASSQAEDDEDA